MTCLRCKGLIIFETVFAENKFIDDIHCVNCGERFFKNIPTYRRDRASRRLKVGRKLSNNFNKL